MKKTISIFLALIFVLSALFAVPMSAQAKKKGFSSYKAVINYYYDNYDVGFIGYNYLTVKTPYGKQKALIVDKGDSLKQRTRVYVKNKENRAVKHQVLYGSIVSFSKDRKYLLTQEHVDTGTEVIRLYQYKKKDKKYVWRAQGHTQYGSRFPKEITYKQALKNIKKKTKVNVLKFKKFDSGKYVIYSYYD